MSSPKPPRPTYTLVPGPRDSASAFVGVYTRAFQEPLFDALFPGRAADPAGYAAHIEQEQAKSIQHEDVSWATVVAKHPSAPGEGEGEIVAAGKWQWYSGAARPHKEEEAEESEDHWPGLNKQFHDTFFGDMEKAHKRIMGDRPHYIIHVLATVPEYQGRGAISPVIRHVLALARERNAPVYIEGSSMGVPVYRHFGWRDVETYTVELPPGEVDTILMINEQTQAV